MYNVHSFIGWLFRWHSIDCFLTVARIHIFRLPLYLSSFCKPEDVFSRDNFYCEVYRNYVHTSANIVHCLLKGQKHKRVSAQGVLLISL